MNLRAQGSMNDLALDIRSPNRPELSQTDLVALLLTGRTSTAAAAEGGAILAEELAAALGGALQKSVGDDVADRGVERRVDAARRGRPDAALQDRHAGRPGPRGVLLDPPRRHRAALGRAVEPPRRPVHVPRDPGLRGGADRRGDRPAELQRLPRPRAPGTTTSAPLSRLDSLRFEGELPLPEEELRRSAKLKIGQPLRPAAPRPGRRPRAGEAGRGRVSRRLGRRDGARGRGPEGPRRPRAEGGGGAEDRRSPGSGDDPGEKVRKRALEAWPPYASPEAAAAAVARTARIELQAAGHYEAKVDHEVRVDGRRDRHRAERRPGAEGPGRRRGVRGQPSGSPGRSSCAPFRSRGRGSSSTPWTAGPASWPGRGSPTRASATCARASGPRGPASTRRADG